jgi:hypothetical protein
LKSWKSYLILLNFLLVGIQVTAQIKDASIVSIQKDESYFSGSINEKYNIELYLKMTEFSEDHADVYFVKGWYFYKDKGIKIPLEGLVTWERMTLYQFKDVGYLNIEKANQNGLNIFSFIDSFESIKNYKERFQFEFGNSSGLKGNWKAGTKTMMVQIYSPEIDIVNRKNYLQFTKSNTVHQINLEQYAGYHADYKLISNFIEKDSSCRFLIHVSFMSRSNLQGMCGAGQEIEYLVLDYDKDLNLKSKKEFLIESCLESIYSEEKQTENSIFYQITYSDNTIKNLKVDKKNSTCVLE